MYSDIPTWKNLITHTLTTHERVSLITMIFSDRDQTETVRRLNGDNAQTFIDTIDKVRSYTISNPTDGAINAKLPRFVNQELDSLPLEVREKCLVYLPMICGSQTLIPSSLKIPLCCDMMKTPQCRGGVADVWKGKHDDQEVAAKVFRAPATNDFEGIRRVGLLELAVFINGLTASCTAIL